MITLFPTLSPVDDAHLKQILQNLKDGSTEIAEVPCPRLAPGHLLLRTTRTLISAGTERMLVGQALVGAGRYRPWHWVPASRPGRRKHLVIAAGKPEASCHSGRDDGSISSFRPGSRNPGQGRQGPDHVHARR